MLCLPQCVYPYLSKKVHHPKFNCIFPLPPTSAVQSGMIFPNSMSQIDKSTLNQNSLLSLKGILKKPLSPNAKAIKSMHLPPILNKKRKVSFVDDLLVSQSVPNGKKKRHPCGCLIF